MLKDYLKKKVSDKILYIPIIIISLVFLYRLIDQAQMMWVFPLDFTNDWSSYIAQLSFLDKCGFHNLCPYWYNGFISFQLVPPGWFFFTYLILFFVQDYVKAAFISMLLIFILAFFVVYKFGIANKISRTKSVLFFLLLFANASAIGNYIRLGRMLEFFSFFLFVLFAFIILYYRDKKFDWKFLFVVPIYSLLLISHQTFAVLSSLLLISIFLVKDNKNRLIIIYLFLLALVIDSFWLIDYIKNFFTSAGTISPIGLNLFSLDKEYILENFFSVIIPLIFLVIFFIYIKKNKYNRKEILFFLPIVIISLLFLFRITAFIQVFRYIYADVYMGFILFFILYLFFKNFKINRLFFFGLLIISILSLLINVFYTPYFVKHTELEENTLELLGYVDDSFYITPHKYTTSYSKAYYSYAPIYLNLSTPSGWYKIKPTSYYDKLREFSDSVVKRDCKTLKKGAYELNDTYIISYDEDCDFLETCRINKIKQVNNVCLYRFNR